MWEIIDAQWRRREMGFTGSEYLTVSPPLWFSGLWVDVLGLRVRRSLPAFITNPQLRVEDYFLIRYA